MTLAEELAALYRRDLTRLGQELRGFADPEAIWRKSPEVNNSAGNLVLHLEGNLREYIGRQIGGIAYQRQRDQEFSQSGVSLTELASRVDALAESIPALIATLTEPELDRIYPEEVFGKPISTRQLLMTLLAHLNYHLGQIDYQRRLLAGGGAVSFVGL